MPVKYKVIRDKIIQYGVKMAQGGYVLGTWGNISARTLEDDYIAITPSGVDYDTIGLEDIVIVDKNGNVIDGKLKPSIELMLHLEIYKNRPDVNAIVHTHSEYVTAFAIARKPIPAAAEDLVQIAGGDIRVSEYQLPGTKELGFAAVKALEGRNAVILSNHGCLAAGKDVKEAYKIALIVEKSAKATVFAKILGEVVELSEGDIQIMREFYLHKYGQR
jgi:L-fuculose-phosphate aldolase